MTRERPRVHAAWLRLREPADAAARSSALVEELRPALPTTARTVVHDLGCGTGAMARWLAGRLTGEQHWVLHDRDAALLRDAAADAPERAGDGAPVTVETRRGDVTRLGPAGLAGASLVTASALLDTLTAAELDGLVQAVAAAGCPVLLTLTVTGRVELTPPDPDDARVATAFNAHQCRDTGRGRLLGPDAVGAAADRLRRRGLRVLLRPTPWRLGPGEAELTEQWLAGWLAAAYEQRPGLARADPAYARRRRAQAAVGGLGVTVHHRDLLALPG